MGAIIANFAKRIFQPLWHGFLDSLDGVFSSIIHLINLLLCTLLKLLFWFIETLLGFIPELPQPDTSSIDTGMNAIAMANQFVPLGEMLGLLPLIGSVFGAIGIYKVSKFIRGAG